MTCSLPHPLQPRHCYVGMGKLEAALADIETITTQGGLW